MRSARMRTQESVCTHDETCPVSMHATIINLSGRFHYRGDEDGQNDSATLMDRARAALSAMQN